MEKSEVMRREGVVMGGEVKWVGGMREVLKVNGFEEGAIMKVKGGDHWEGKRDGENRAKGEREMKGRWNGSGDW